MAEGNPYIETCENREVTFIFRRRSYRFSLSQGLFSSADIDSGSKFLLKTFSKFLDDCGSAFFTHAEDTGSLSVLDAGCGVGVLGICAAGALSDSGASSFQVHSQDRDELARIFTEYNARRNGIPDEILGSCTEPLLAGPAGWDIILTNIPAKAGLPVLEDFVRRSAALLKKDGRVFLVAVNTLAEFFRSGIKEYAALLAEESGKEHTVFVYAKPTNEPAEKNNEPLFAPVILDENFPAKYPFYIRNKGEYETEGIRYSLDTVHGAPDFDNPGAAAQAASHLVMKLNLSVELAAEKITPGKILVHDAGQGHFALWLMRYLELARSRKFSWVLSGRNIVALAAARAAFMADRSAFPGAGNETSAESPSVIPSVDIFLDRERLGAGGERFKLISFFPERISETDRREANWMGLKELAAPGGIIIAGMSSVEAERFDRKKPAAFIRLGDIKRRGFRALSYQAR